MTAKNPPFIPSAHMYIVSHPAPVDAVHLTTGIMISFPGDAVHRSVGVPRRRDIHIEGAVFHHAARSAPGSGDAHGLTLCISTPSIRILVGRSMICRNTDVYLHSGVRVKVPEELDLSMHPLQGYVGRQSRQRASAGLLLPPGQSQSPSTLFCTSC